MTTAIALQEPQGGEITLRLASELAKAQILSSELRNRPADVLLTMLTGRELGIGPMAALRLIYVVEGKPTLSGQLQLALLRRAGHRVREMRADSEVVELEGIHSTTKDVVKASYTMAEVQAAGIDKGRNGIKDNWAKYPADMLYWRCVSRLARRLDPTATGGLYAPEDFDERVPEPEVVVSPTVDEAGTEDMFEGEG